MHYIQLVIKRKKQSLPHFQKFWDIIKKPNLLGVKEGAQVQTKGIENLFNEIIEAFNIKILPLHLCVVQSRIVTFV
jgi:hypothetical protein